MKYEKVIEILEGIKANELDTRKDFEAVEILNDSIMKLEILQSE